MAYFCCRRAPVVCSLRTGRGNWDGLVLQTSEKRSCFSSLDSTVWTSEARQKWDAQCAACTHAQPPLREGVQGQRSSSYGSSVRWQVGSIRALAGGIDVSCGVLRIVLDMGESDMGGGGRG